MHGVAEGQVLRRHGLRPGGRNGEEGPQLRAASADGPPTRLAVYGTLAPGRSNHHELSGLRGRWSAGLINGRLRRIASGPARGYPGLVLDPAAGPVPVHLFTSPDLPRHWARLDAFEGEGYRRVIADARVAGRRVAASIYVLDTPYVAPDM